ncbi:MAG: TolC family protein [Candidatus Omnitrophota bacterium]
MKQKKYNNKPKTRLWRCIALSLVFAFALGLTPFSGAESTEVPKRSMMTLEECIQIALDNHLPLRIAEKQLKLAKFRLLEAQRKIGPSFATKLETSSGEVQGRKYTGAKVTVEGKQPVFYGGELVFSVGQAKTNLKIVRNDYDRIKNELILQVEKAYYSVDKAGKALGIQEKLQSRIAELYSMVKSGYEANVIAQIEFLEISSQHNQAGFQVLSATEDCSIANLLLQQSMNVDRDVEIAGTGEPRIIELDLENCFGLASLNRPELRIGRLSLEYFGYEKKIMQARATFPRVDFLGMYGNMREDFVKGDLSGKDPRGLGPEYYVGMKASWPFWGSTVGYSSTKETWQSVVSAYQGTESVTHSITFDILNKMEDLSGLQEAELELMRALEEVNRKEQEITLEVKETFFKYRKAIVLMGVAGSKVEFQTKQVEILEIRRQLGEAQYSDVAEELIKLAEERFSFVQAIADYFIAIASLNKAIGIERYFEI